MTLGLDFKIVLTIKSFLVSLDLTIACIIFNITKIYVLFNNMLKITFVLCIFLLKIFDHQCSEVYYNHAMFLSLPALAVFRDES